MSWKELEALLPHISIVSIVFFGLISRILDYLKHKNTVKLVMKLLVADPNIDKELLKSITQPTTPPFSDFRRGTVLIAMSGACLLFAQNMMDPEYKQALQGLSAFPGLIGLTYIIFYSFSKNNSEIKS